MVKSTVTFEEGRLQHFLEQIGEKTPKPSGTCEDAAFFRSEDVF